MVVYETKPKFAFFCKTSQNHSYWQCHHHFWLPSLRVCIAPSAARAGDYEPCWLLQSMWDYGTQGHLGLSSSMWSKGVQTVSSSLLVTESMAVTNAQRSNILSYFGIIWNWDFSECYCVCFVIECSSTYGWHFKIFIGVAVFLFFNLLDVLWSGNHPLIDGPSTRLVETRARQHGPCWQVMETGHPSSSPLTWAVNSGSGNRAL